MGQGYKPRITVRVFFFASTLILTCYVAWLTYEQKAMHYHRLFDYHDQPNPRFLKRFLVNDPNCIIPKINPMATEVRKYYSPHRLLHCRGRETFLKVRNGTTVYVDNDLLSKVWHVKLQKCVYTAIERDPSKANLEDDTIKLINRKNSDFTDSVDIEDEFVKIDCYSTTGRRFHEEYKALAVTKPQVERRCTKSSTFDAGHPKLNVLVFGIDSISKLNFLRHFNKTYSLLKTLNAVELNGYNKVAENTLVNMVPLLTGKYVESYLNHTKPLYFDHVDLIWKYYAQEGYRTLFAEDAPTIGMFNYKKRGFRKPPSDYYFRPAALAIEKSVLKAKSSNHCFGNRLEFSYVLDWVKRFADSAKEKSFFAWVFLSRLTHDILNFAGYADEPSYEFIKGLYTEDKETMNNTVMIFMSDHGIRFGNILKTYIGKLEERLPFMFLIFPDWFQHKYPTYYNNLVVNQWRLTTPFDIFETLKDILYISTGYSIKNHSSPGISLFEEIPKNRSCEDASISTHYCACHKYKPVSINDNRVVNATLTAIKSINDRLLASKNDCASLSLKQILSSTSYLPESSIQNEIKQILNYLIVFKVHPSDGEFEATVTFRNFDNTFQLEGEVSRINKYGNQSYCVSDSSLAPICYCSKNTSTLV